MARCRSCQARVVWAQTTKGNLMPLDADPDSEWERPLLDPDSPVAPTGRYVTSNRGARVMEVEVLDQQALFEEDRPRRYRSHFASCPNAATHRKDRS